jgi:hypothetical protein
MAGAVMISAANLANVEEIVIYYVPISLPLMELIA